MVFTVQWEIVKCFLSTLHQFPLSLFLAYIRARIFFYMYIAQTHL